MKTQSIPTDSSKQNATRIHWIMVLAGIATAIACAFVVLNGMNGTPDKASDSAFTSVAPVMMEKITSVPSFQVRSIVAVF